MALGVAVIVAIALVNRALTTSFQSTIEQIAGKAVLQVSNSESGMAEALLPLVRDTEGVLEVAAAVDGFLPVSGVRAERLYIYGVDLLTDFTMRDHQFAGDGFGFDKALDFIARPDSIAVTESFARRLGLSIGSALELNTSQGKQNYRVSALLKEEGTARVFGGNFALMDLPVAQLAFGKEGKLDIIDLTVEDWNERRNGPNQTAPTVGRRGRGRAAEKTRRANRVVADIVSRRSFLRQFDRPVRRLFSHLQHGFGLHRATQARDRHPALPGHAPLRTVAADRRRGADSGARRRDASAV